MKILLAVCAVALGACAPADREDERSNEATKTTADTAVTTREVQDTAIVRTDTTVRTDTNVETDTIRKSGSKQPSDTTRNP